MKIYDLLYSSILCDYLEITIRENGVGKWIYQYIITEHPCLGLYSEVFVKDRWIDSRSIVISEPLEWRKEVGGGNKLGGLVLPFDPYKVDKVFLNLYVCDWRCMNIHSAQNRWGLFVSAYPDGFSQPIKPKSISNQLTLF